MKPFGFRPRMPHASAARDSNPEPLRPSMDHLRSGRSVPGPGRRLSLPYSG